MSEEVIVKGFLNEDTLSCGRIVKSTYDDRDYISVDINLEGDTSLYFSKEVNTMVKGDLPEVIGLLQILDLFVKEVQKAESPEEVTEGEIVEEAANETATTAEVGGAGKGTIKGV